MDLDALKLRISNVIDDWAEEQGKDKVNPEIVGVFPTDPNISEDKAEEEPKRVLPEGYRVVRTKSSGDRVYYLDEEKMTRQWVTNPEVLAGVGFELGDVVDVEDSELLKYQMGPALYRVPDANA